MQYKAVSNTLCDIPLITTNEVLTVINPYICERYKRDSNEGRKLIRQRRNGLLHLIFNKYKGQLSNLLLEKSEDMVRCHYDKSYSSLLDRWAGYKDQPRKITFQLGEWVLKMNGVAQHLAGIHVITRIVAALKPQSVCECGCGSGINLFYLAHRNPGLELHGFDLSQRAIDCINALVSIGKINLELPAEDGLLSGESMNTLNHANFFQSSAKKINLPDKAVDILYTHAALEQMWVILPEVLAEIRRVTRRYVVFVEPFADNNDFLARRFLVAGNYFRANFADIDAHGFRVIKFMDILPMKPTFKYSVLIAEVR